MKILILGGTQFVGRAIVEEAIWRHHDVSLFNRNVSNTELFPQLNKFQGDRMINDYSSLLYEQFDVVIDTWFRSPKSCRESMSFLKNKTDLYVYISSISVDDVPSKQSTFHELYDIKRSNFDEYFEYCSNKLNCEREIYTNNEDMVLIFRPGIIIGRYDNTDRFNYKTETEAYWKHTDKQVTEYTAVDSFAKRVINYIENNIKGVYENI